MKGFPATACGQLKVILLFGTAGSLFGSAFLCKTLAPFGKRLFRNDRDDRLRKKYAKYLRCCFINTAKQASKQASIGAKGIAVLPLLPIFPPFFHFHKNPSSSVISGTFSRENRLPPKPKKRPNIAKHTKHEPLPKRDAISLKFP
jgi:hypothetical protein